MTDTDFDAETFYDRQIEVAFGLNREDKHWRTQKLALGALYAQHFQEFKRGPKDGRAMTQGGLIGPARKAKAVKACSIVMLDHDTGETMDEIADAIRARGLYATLWHTHSNGKAESEIPESKLVQFLRKDKDWLRDRTPSTDDSTLIEQVADYLKKIKKLSSGILDSIEAVTKQHTDKGMMFIVHHAPMPRVRSMFVRAEEFVFAARGGTQDAAIDEWKDRYAGLSVSLGLPYDPSCVDPSRLMYLPRMPVDANEEDFEIREIEGRLLTDADMPRLSELEKAAVDPLEAAAAALRKDTGGASGVAQANWKTKGLRAFLAKHADDFEIEEFFEAHGLENRGQKTTGTTFECPTDGLHSDAGNPDDRGFFAQNASSNPNGTFACACVHATCKQASIAATGKVDRAWFLDEFCAARGLTVEDLRDFCPNYQRDEDERVEEEVKTGDAITDAINALTRETPVDGIMSALELLAKTPDDLICADRLDQIKRKTGKGIRTLRDQLTAFRLAAAGGGDGGDGDNDGIVADMNPPPDDGANAAIIWAHWGYSDMVRCVRQRLIAKNTENPVVFSRPEGGYCRKAIVGDRVVFRDIKESSDWVNILSHHMRFMRPQTERAPETEVAPFKDAVMALNGANDLPFGVIDRVVEVPVFNREGGIRTKEGYDELAGTWFHPNGVTFYDVPEEVTQEDVDAALALINEMYVDFPFSDCYSGGDPLPIKTDELDADGHPIPNYERGKAARANTYAMLLLPFARALIEGPCPVYFIDKPAAGTGAGYLADTLGYALFGHKMPAQTIPEQEDELRKQITATLRDGDPAIFLDNLNHSLDSGALASALSTGVFKGRILGQSEMVRMPIRSTWIIAANNGKLSHELMRRVVPIRLDAGVPNPAADRAPDSYKYDLGSFCRKNRDGIVWACHVLVRNWLQQGRRQDRTRVIQTFEEWSGVMGGILSAAGIPGFLENVPDYLSERGEEQANESGFVQRLYERCSHEWFNVGTAFDACLMMGTTDKVDPDLGLELNGRDETGLRKSLGRAMSKMTGKTFRLMSGKLVSLSRGKKNNQAIYQLSLK